MRILYLFILFTAVQTVKAQTTIQTGAGKVVDSLSMNAQDTVMIIPPKPANDFWEAGIMGGFSSHEEFIANTENVTSPVYGIRLAKHARQVMFGVGYDAQTFALRTTEQNKPANTYKYGKPQHTFYGFINLVHRKQKWDVHFGVLAGYSNGEAEDSEGFSKFKSSKGPVVGLNTGFTRRLSKHIHLALEFNPKMYLLTFEKTTGKTESVKVLTLPVQVGLMYRLY